MAEQWLAECNASSFGLKAEVDKHLEDMNTIVNSPSLLDDLLLLINDKEQVVGYMGLRTFTSPLSDQVIANEHNYYVRPESRGHGGLRLFIEARKWAKENGCSHRIMTASRLASSLYERTCKLYEKMGMKEFETSYISEV